METTSATLRPENPLDKDGLCLLCLDGGGVRGLSSLLILQALMGKVNEERAEHNLPAVKPCELFDFIGGTSTGGIIAIMLGVLKMDVHECIDAYTDMFAKIFSRKGLPVNLFGKIRGRFDSVVLEECVRKILRDRGVAEDQPLNDGTETGCKVAVCAKAKETASTILFRSYRSRDVLNNSPATICEAVRATSAATSFFKPATIGPRKRTYVDGGMGANNPAEQIWNEAQNIWCSGREELGQVLKCMVSIGTGNPGRRPIADGAWTFFTNDLVRLVTQTEDTARIFVERHRRLLEEKRYFRFNVQQGLQNVGLEEHKKVALIDAATSEYMDGQETKLAARECGQNLRHKNFSHAFSATKIIEWQQALAKSLPTERTFTYVLHRRNNDFTARLGIFETLDGILSQDSTNRTAAIWGLGGCGKTQVVLEYAYRRQQQLRCSIFWVHANSDARFRQDFSSIARLVGISREITGDDLLIAVCQWIENCNSWILVLDNADDLSIFKDASGNANPAKPVSGSNLHQYIPKGTHGTIIWTSRDGGICGSLVDVRAGIHLEKMTMQESLNLFQTRSGTGETTEPSESESELFVLLDFLALAITQAAAYIRTTKIPVKVYTRLFKESEERQIELLSHASPDVRRDVPTSVLRAWLISMQQIASESPCAARVLRLIAFFENKGLPFELIQAAAGPEYSQNEVLLAAGRLQEFSFLQAQQTLDESLPIYEQHRLVGLATKQSLTQTETESLSSQALGVINSIFPHVSYDTWESCEQYLPHSLKVITGRDRVVYEETALSLMQRVGLYYFDQGRSDEAEKLHVEVLDLQRSVLGLRHPDTITVMANLAVTWWQQGRSDEAEKVQIEVLDLRKSVLGLRQPDTIKAMANLAVTWWQQGRSDEAEKLQVEVLDLQRSVLGLRHPDTITVMANLAEIWWQQGRSDEAEKLKVEALDLRKSVSGLRHPDTIKAMANLAGTWRRQGRSDEAEKLEVEVLNLRKSILGLRHPDTLQAEQIISQKHRRIRKMR